MRQVEYLIDIKVFRSHTLYEIIDRYRREEVFIERNNGCIHFEGSEEEFDKFTEKLYGREDEFKVIGYHNLKKEQ